MIQDTQHPASAHGMVTVAVAPAGIVTASLEAPGVAARCPVEVESARVHATETFPRIVPIEPVALLGPSARMRGFTVIFFQP
eukprot:COSAG02_NODE_50554_length_319_cov_10.836364_2_plen_81_part_01